METLEAFFGSQLIIVSVINMHDNISSMLLEGISSRGITRFWNEISRSGLWSATMSSLSVL